LTLPRSSAAIVLPSMIFAVMSTFASHIHWRHRPRRRAIQ
jgi:hypothetical protein